MKVVGIDIGYGFLKIHDGEKFLVVPSVIGNAVDLTFEIKNQGIDLSNIEVEYEDEKYFVGDLAILQSEHPYRSLSTDRTTDIVVKIMFLTGLALLSEHPIESFSVVTGLPVKDYLLYKDTYVQNFTGTHTIHLNGQKKVLNVNKVIVVPQPYGTYCDGLFKADGSVDEDFAENHVGIIDIGYKTSDFIQVKEYNYLERFSSTSANGISSIYKDIANYLATNHSIYKEDYELENVIHDGFLRTRSGKIDISDALSKAKRTLAKKIANEIKSLWSNLPEISLIIVTGGGGSLLYPELIEFLVEDMVLASEPQTANVRGYRNWGVYLESDE